MVDERKRSELKRGSDRVHCAMAAGGWADEQRADVAQVPALDSRRRLDEPSSAVIRTKP
jgi:hypothetical protein